MKPLSARLPSPAMIVAPISLLAAVSDKGTSVSLEGLNFRAEA
jgi:hypothetical protein